MSDPGRLRLFQLVSPALPVGAFSYSEGLEVLLQAGRLVGVEPLQAWLQAELQRGLVAVETAALAPMVTLWRGWLRGADDGDVRAVEAAAAALFDLDGWLLAQREAPELRAQQRQMGQSLLLLLADLGYPMPVHPAVAAAAGAAAFTWPTAFAWAGCCLELCAPAMEEAYLYSWVANQISAAVRLVPLGPTQGQRLQLALAPLIAERAATLAQADPWQLWNGGVGAGLVQLQHTELYSRLFRS